ncbi:hypothetical protein [Limosilactobacillus equigenerosi]|uniref:Uncharacterized protein n=1 Tax=Limosilactobacillus equigenerosi DSM 18793 = JCM 14505 TaxID=1423742 RepID=A0A0R1V433_9LACO|nr:hypothetical protein [Limosilactobacillus equigenerosi]KRL96539.1 hypothetical protein FC21_GL000911 [Limosilactobacillus equigenerosi DSM 18793 = JCM 14505]
MAMEETEQIELFSGFDTKEELEKAVNEWLYDNTYKNDFQKVAKAILKDIKPFDDGVMVVYTALNSFRPE